MTTGYFNASRFLERLYVNRSEEELLQRLGPDMSPPGHKVVSGDQVTTEIVARRWENLPCGPACRKELLDPRTVERMEIYQRNIENFIGTMELPVGVAGPIRVNGLFAHGDYYIPLATTEAALVASYNRGAQLISGVGGCTAMVVNEGVSRAPGFSFASIAQSSQFISWAVSSMEEFRQVAASTTRHGRLVDMRVSMEGNHVYLIFDFLTGEASGQNMATVATEAICGFILNNSPVAIRRHYVEANMSGDKKASSQSFSGVRGKKVTAEVLISADMVKKHLHTTPEQMLDYWQMSAVGGILSGTIGIQGHYANGLTALYIACGQDVACVAESAVGVTRLGVEADGSLYAAVTLPNLMVGTVGGGTGLPSQRACLDILGLTGPNKSHTLAEIAAGLSLAGELSIVGALVSGEFTSAHQRLARGSKVPEAGGEKHD